MHAEQSQTAWHGQPQQPSQPAAKSGGRKRRMQTCTAQPEFGPRRVGVLCRLPASCMAQLREHEVLLKLTWPARLERERSCQMGRRKRRKHVEASEAAAAVAGSRCSFNLRPGLRRTVPPLLSCAGRRLMQNGWGVSASRPRERPLLLPNEFKSRPGSLPCYRL